MHNTERASFERAPHRDPEDLQASLLYPLMLIAAIAVIVFSIVGIASLIGVMPRALSNGQTAAPEGRNPAASGESPRKTAPTTGERRTGVIRSIHVVQTSLAVTGGRAIGGAPSTSTEAGPGSARPPIAGPGYSNHDFINRHVTYRVRVRMDDDGRLSTFYETSQPVYGVGQKVLVTGRTLLAEG